jgi:hypothetical protein
MILTEQMREYAREVGILEREDVKASDRLIRERLLAERYWQNFRAEVEPAESEIKDYYEANKLQFRRIGRTKGRRLDWRIAGYENLTASEKKFQATVLRNRLENMLRQVREGKLSKEEFEAKADAAQELGWFNEGPMGYASDMAFFGTEPGNYTEVFPLGSGMAIGFVEEQERGEPIGFEESKEKAKRFVVMEKSRAERGKLVERILQEFAAMK